MNFGLKEIPVSKIGEIVSLDTLTLMPEPIKVTPRQTGMTSTGTFAHCHANVRELVNRYGGRMITGYELCWSPNGMILNWHSVWQTPEGKVVDVTQLKGRGTFLNRMSEFLFIPICLSRSNLFPNTRHITPILLGKTMKYYEKGNGYDNDVNTEILFEFKDRNEVKIAFFIAMEFAFKRTEFDYAEKENESHFKRIA